MRFILLLAAISILSAILALPCPSLAANASGKQAETIFKLTPDIIQTKAGEKFEVNLSVNSPSNLDAVEIDLAFDPQKLELTSFAPTTNFNAEVRNEIDNKAGNLLWTTVDIQKPRKIISGEINLGTLTFTSKESGQSAISFKQAQACSIDSPGIQSKKNTVQVTVTGDISIFERIISFFTRIFGR